MAALISAVAILISTAALLRVGPAIPLTQSVLRAIAEVVVRIPNAMVLVRIAPADNTAILSSPVLLAPLTQLAGAIAKIAPTTTETCIA
jgi:hypothetical protein